MPTTPDSDAGIRMEPAWSPPVAMSTSPRATNAPEPVEDPPGVWPQARGLCTGPDMLVAAPPENEKYSQTDLPTISAPASSRSEEHTSELQSPDHLVCRLLLEKKNMTLYD